MSNKSGAKATGTKSKQAKVVAIIEKCVEDSKSDALRQPDTDKKGKPPRQKKLKKSKDVLANGGQFNDTPPQAKVVGTRKKHIPKDEFNVMDV